MALTEQEFNKEQEHLNYSYDLILKETDELKQNIQNKFKNIVNINKDFREDVPTLNGGADWDQITEIYKYNDIVEAEERDYNQVNARLRVLAQMENSAYFGKIDFLEDGEYQSDKYYVGISSLKNEDDDFFVLDWRAPICALYYQYETGKCKYECPSGIIEGELLSKRQFGITKNKLNFAFDTDILIEDEMLCKLLSASRDKKMGHIVKSIQKEQNEAIRKSSAQHLVIFGPAGSGKTSVAMHRAAYLLYKHKDTIKADNMLVLSPNSIFMDYISEVLPDLGEANVDIKTITDLFSPLLKDFTITGHCELMETMLSTASASESHRFKQAKFKNSVTFLEILKRYAKFVDSNDFAPRNVEYMGQTLITAEEISRLYYHDWARMNYSQRLKRISAKVYSVLDEIIAKRKKEIEEDNGDLFDWEIEQVVNSTINTEFASIRSKINNMFSVNTTTLYANMFKSKEFYDTITDLTDISFEEFSQMLDPNEYFNRHNLNREDLFPLLFVRCVIDGQRIPTNSIIKFIFIDEFQDISPTGIYILQTIFDKASITLVGDINQTIDPTAQIYNEDVIAKCLERSADVFKLTKSYRSTKEITSFANKIISESDVEYMDRTGDPVEVYTDFNDEQKNEFIKKCIIRSAQRNLHSVGIICKDSQSASKLYSSIKGFDDKQNIALVLDDNDSYSSGAVVIPSYLSKGLEFDVVIVYDAQNYDIKSEERLYYTVCTRAMHKLVVFGEPKV